MQQSLIANWIPWKLNLNTEGEWEVKWLNLENQRMIHPFFDETISLCRCIQKDKSLPDRISNPDFLCDAAASLEGLEPSAFIFHVSRCGSTLLSQVFTAPEENIVVAEAPLLDEILRADEIQPELSLTTIETWFRAALKCMGQKRNLTEKNYIVKLDSWHIHFYALLRSWFPATPFFFLYRKPEEVIASHTKLRGIHAVPGMINHQLLQTDPPETFGGDFNRYTAQVLEQYYLKLQAIYALDHAKNHFFDYGDGVVDMIQTFSSFAEVPLKDQEQVQNRLRYHSKSPSQTFATEQFIQEKTFPFTGCHDAYTQLASTLKNLTPP